MTNVRVLELRGDIDASQRQSIEKQFGDVEWSNSATFTIVDLTRVRYLDTTFLNALMRIRNRMARNEPYSRLCLVAPRANIVWRLFEITKFDRMFSLFDSMTSARRSAEDLMPARVVAGPARVANP